MERQSALLAVRGLTDARDRLVTADDPLADLQTRCGGTLPGTLAVPELLELVQQGRRLGFRIAREFSAFDGDALISGLVRIRPFFADECEGCELLLENLQSRASPDPSTHETAQRLDAIDRACAEMTARLDDKQRVQLVQAGAPDTKAFEEVLLEKPESVWTDHVTLEGIEHRQTLHWRLLDGVKCQIPGSQREWKARLLPLGSQSSAPSGFELLLVADHPLGPLDPSHEPEVEPQNHTQLIGGALTPVLKQPIARVIANAETVRARLAGPLRLEYSEYAGNIAAAGQLLNSLLDDLADLEVVEAQDFTTQCEPVDLLDIAQRAAGILGVRAQAKGISVTLPPSGDFPPALGEFRRVLQIAINLIGNAIAYSPEGSVVTLRVAMAENESTVSLSVSDEGPGIDEDQAARVFDKFERLGRDNDGGTGLGLYISARLAEAMKCVLESTIAGEEGACFRLSLPVYRED